LNPENPKSRSRSKTSAIPLVQFGGFLVAALIIAAGLAIQSGKRAGVHAEVQKRLEAIRAAGYPMTALDLAKRYPDPPPERDAALLLKPALAVLAIPEDPTNLFCFGLDLPRSAPLDPVAASEGRACLDRNQTALAMVPWSQIVSAWIGSGYTNGLTNITGGPLKAMDQLASLLCLKAVLSAEQHQAHAAMDSLRQASEIANTLKNDLQIHFLTKSDIELRVLEALERAVNRASIPETDLESFPGCLTMSNRGATKETLLFNEVPRSLFDAQVMQSKANNMTRGFVSPWRRPLRAYPGDSPYDEGDLLEYLKWHEQSSVALEAPMPGAIQNLRNLDALRGDSPFDPPRTGRVSLMAIHEPSVRSFFLQELMAVARVRAAILALAVERWRIAGNGRLPGSIAELVPRFIPAIPADPFDGKPLRYRKLPNGYMIFSDGENLTEDWADPAPAWEALLKSWHPAFTVDR
jgi:hypothetical protein